MKLTLLNELPQQFFYSNKILHDALKKIPSFDDIDLEGRSFSSNLRQALIDYHQRLKADKQTIENIKTCEYLVISAQQPSPAVGPMFNLYKIIHTIKLADKLSQHFSKPIAPAFFNVSDDINYQPSFSIKEDNLCRIECNIGEFKGVPLCYISTDKVKYPNVKEYLPLTEFTESINELIEAAKATQTFSEYFSYILLNLFSKWGLVVIDAKLLHQLPEYKKIIQNEIESPELTIFAFKDTTQELIRKGYKPQIYKKETQSPLFLLKDRKRLPLFYEDGLFKSNSTTYTKEDLLTLLDKDSSSILPNVILRPIIMAECIPFIVYVAGPHEFVYYIQLEGVFRRYSKKVLVISRLQATIIEPKIKRILQKYNLPSDALFWNDKDLWKACLRDPQITSFVERLDRISTCICEDIGLIKADIAEIFPELQSIFEKSQGRMKKEITSLKSRIIRERKRKDEYLQNQILRLRTYTFPNNTPQERLLDGFYFINKFGFDFIDALFDTLKDRSTHQVLEIS